MSAAPEDTPAAAGILTRESPYSFSETQARLEQAVAAGGLTLFTRIDHRAGAEAKGLRMQPATVLVFGNPSLGTPAMLEQPLLALDLPSRVLVWAKDGRARVSYQDPDFVARRFDITPELPRHVAALVEQALRADA